MVNEMIRIYQGSVIKSSVLTLFILLFFSIFVNARYSSSYYDILRLEADNSDIYIPEADKSSIFTLNQDLIDFHHPSLYESIQTNQSNNSNSLLIVKDEKGTVKSVIHIKSSIRNKKNNF